MAISSEEHVHLCIGLLRQHRCVPVYPHHPAFQSHHNQEGHPSPGQGEAPPSTARYWEAVLELLWPRFELILEMNIESIRNTDPQKLDTQISSAIVEVENFVLKMAAEFPSRRDQLIFLINNYDMMLNVLMERAADDSKEDEGFQQLLQARNQFIEEILSSPLVA